jgi:protein-disulfide isomerase
MLKIFAYITTACVIVAPAFASTASSLFTPAQRGEIVIILRDALKSDPSILRDAVTAMQKDDDRLAAQQSAISVHANLKAIYNDPSDQIGGNPNGTTVLVEFYDPRCPYCKRTLEIVGRLIAANPRLKVIYKDIPVLGAPSQLISCAIYAAAKQNAYLKMQTALMTETAPPSEALIRAKATTLGLNADKLIADMKSSETHTKLQANLDLAKTLGVTGTPSFVIGGELIGGEQDYDALHQMLAQKGRKTE